MKSIKSKHVIRHGGVVVTRLGEGDAASYLIEVPCAAPSLNELLRMKHSDYAMILRDWKVSLRAARSPRHNPIPAFEAHVVRAVGRRDTLDLDNLYGSCKIPLDALRHSGWVLDDDRSALRKLTCDQTIAPPEGPTTFITITPV